MEHLWVIVSLIAAVVQTSRNGLMKHLKGKLDDEAIMLSRFAFSVPFAACWFLGLVALGNAVPEINVKFVWYAFLAVAFQIAGGLLLLRLFGRRNFVIGITYARMDAMMAALYGAIIFGEFVTIGAAVAIILGFVGILLINVAEKQLEPQNLLKRICTPSAIMGMCSGLCFGVSSLFIRHSILALDGAEFFMRSTYTLVYMQALQALIVLAIVYIKNKQQIAQIFKVGRSVYMVGLTNSISSFMWFVAFSLTNAAHVSMVGQVEIVFSIFLTHKVFKEKIVPLEILGMAVVMGSILLLVWVK